MAAVAPIADKVRDKPADKLAGKPAGALDVERLRAQFPILAREVHGKPLIYLDNAASAQKPRAVLQALEEIYTNRYANVHRSMHQLGNLATEAYEGARQKVQRFLGAAQADEIVFTASGTDALNLVASSFVAPRLKPGDEIVLSVLEHHSNIVPWHFLRERSGAVLRWVGLTEAGELDLEMLARALTPKTRLVALTHMSNVLGQFAPLAKVRALTAAAGVPLLVDGCQGAVHAPVNVQAMDCDFYVCTGHKLYGPTGVGVLFGKAQHLAAMRPWRGGGEMIEEVTQERVRYAEPPQRFEAGTPPFVQAAGLGAALDFLGAQDRAQLEAHEAQLGAAAAEKLAAIDGIRVLGAAAHTRRNTAAGSIVSFVHESVHPHDMATLLDRYGIAVRAGQHCAEPLLQALGLTACLRASFAFYNRLDEVDALADGVARAIDFFARA